MRVSCLRRQWNTSHWRRGYSLRVLDFCYSGIPPHKDAPLTPPQVNILRSALYELNDLPTLAFSLDDLYLTNADQRRLAAANPDNPLLQHRGQPSTHDIALGKQIFKSLKRGLPTKIPKYDKSAYDGQGERLPESEWEMVNDVANGQQRIQVVIFEGWCVGFRARPAEEIRAAWEDAVRKKAAGDYDGQLANVKLEHVMKLNEALKEYDVFTEYVTPALSIDLPCYLT